MLEVRKTDAFVRWLHELRDVAAKARVWVRIERLITGNPGDVAPVGEGGSRSYAFTTAPANAFTSSATGSYF